jgi:hypothetical protein
MMVLLCALLSTAVIPMANDSSVAPADTVCTQADSLSRITCEDSLALAREAEALRDSLAGEERSLEQARARGYVANLAVDLSQNGSWGGDWAEALYIAAGVVVIGAAILYLPKLVYDLAKGDGERPIFREAALRYAHSGQSWDGGGSTLYRNTHLASARFTIGIQNPSFGFGLTTDAGYVGATFSEGVGPNRVFSTGGTFALIGPSLRLGGEEISLGVDFLNGADFVEQIGWMSEGRFSLRSVVGKRILVGLYAGALFYDLRFFDGLIWRRGTFNRDLALILGLETGVAF